MLHFRSLDGVSLQNVWLTIGSFDGVHRGHRAIVEQLTAGAHAVGAPAVVLTFYPHPVAVLRNRQGPYYLTSPEERAALLGELGVDVVITFPFSRQVADMTAREFMAQVCHHLGLVHLCVGYDFALGRGREGDVSTLEKLGQEFGFVVHQAPQVQVDDLAISSSLIRAALAAGDVERAAGLLGYPYRVSGEVAHGDGRGRTIGIPTANLEIWSEKVIPAKGVYACQAWVDDQAWKAVVNVGYRPTFDGQAARMHVEAHLLDCNTDLYGRTLNLAFAARLREEQRFSGVDALVTQIRQDISRAVKLLP